MHILYIHQYFKTPQEGGGTRSYEFARRLVAKGHKVTVLTGAGDTPLKNSFSAKDNCIDGINVLYADVAYSNYMDYQSRIRNFLNFRCYHCIDWTITFVHSTINLSTVNSAKNLRVLGIFYHKLYFTDYFSNITASIKG